MIAVRIAVPLPPLARLAVELGYVRTTRGEQTRTLHTYRVTQRKCITTADAILRAAQSDVTNEEIERRVALRMARQQVLERPRTEAPRLWMIINEAALRRRVGSPEVMREQLTRLKETAAKPGIHIQVLKFSAGAHASMLNAFSMLTFRDATAAQGSAEAESRSAARPVVHLEQLTSALYLEKAHEIDAYTVAFEHLQANATRPAALNTMIDEILKEF
ncbi:DUF5753 domain-containing protein [Embleya sp. NPDC020886]|uniref:DUF5753 domain-containing protein n=1 Tax=Embleya sp. NPDC020886 TaxID=3363980 RepID=UPI00378B42B3